MNPTNKTFSSHFVILCIGALSLLSAAVANAQTTTINFDSVDASAGPVDATSYLATYGVTLSNESPAGVAEINSDQDYYGNNFVIASSGTNFLMANNNSQANSFTLNFATPLQSFSFTRIAYSSAGSGLLAGWTAQAYSGATPLTSASEPYESETGGKPAVEYTLTGTDITSVTFSANGEGFAGVSGAPVDDLILVDAPEPSTYAMMFVGLALLVFCVRSKAAAAFIA
jgi:hypothetical protein